VSATVPVVARNAVAVLDPTLAALHGQAVDEVVARSVGALRRLARGRHERVLGRGRLLAGTPPAT
jgi:hypothetical protein